MRLGSLATLTTFGMAIAAGLSVFSFWWTLIPAFISGSLAVANGPGYDIVMQANREGRLSVMPRMIGVAMGARLATGGALYWVARWLS